MSKRNNYYSLLYTDRIDTHYRISSTGDQVTRNSEITIHCDEPPIHLGGQPSLSRLNSYVEEEFISESVSRMSIDDTPKKSKKKTDQNRDDVEFFDNISENTFLLSEVDSVFEDKEENTISFEETYNKAKIYDSKPIFDSICYNCGQLLFGKTNKGCKQLAIPSVT